LENFSLNTNVLESRSYEKAFEETWKMYQGHPAQPEPAPSPEEIVGRKAA